MRPLFATSQTLAPSLRARGPNLYLRERDFLRMIALAFLIHLVVLGLFDLLPEQKVTSIPVRSLSFKIGGVPKVEAPAAPVIAATISAAPVPAPAPSTTGWRVEPKPAAAPEKKIEAPQKSAPPKPAPPPQPSSPRASPRAVPVTPPAAPATPPVERQVPEENSSFFDFLTPKKSEDAETPRRYVRSYGAAPQVDTLTEKAKATFAPSDAVTTVTDAIASPLAREQEIRARYEQTLSAWIQQHRIYPASARGREGRVVVRVRIDREGYVRYYALEESAGTDALDRAAVDMIRRANPVPAIPADYPAGNLIEFLIPMTFEAP